MKNYLNLFFLVLCNTIAAQDYTVKYISDDITIDGVESEKIWEEANVGNDFWQWRPEDDVKAIKQTEFKAVFDDENLYFLVKAYTKEKKFTVYSLKRDFSTASADYVQLIFDTFSDATNAFQFQTNHLGLKGDVLVSGGNRDYRTDRNSSWDAIWYVESKLYDDYYLTEIKIPFNQLYFINGAKRWRFNMYRSDTQSLEHSTWVNIPQNQSIGNLAYMGEFNFEKPLGNSKKPVKLIPYINAIQGKDFENNYQLKDFDYGADLKIPIGNSLNLDATLNPDFSQVEVDDQIVNTTKWETRLPEKRQFFTQNSDLFSNFGTRESQTFFSRRIGVAKNKDGEIVENKIIAGVRLSGKINNSTRIGLLNVLTNEDIKNEIPQNNNTLLTFNKKVFSRSNFSFFILNRENTKKYDFVNDSERYNRVIGAEYNLANNDGSWSGKAFIHKSILPDKSNNKKSLNTSVRITRNSRNHFINFYSAYVGDNHRSDLGYFRRYGVYKFEPTYKYRIYPNNEKILNIEIGHFTSFVFRPLFQNKQELTYNQTSVFISYLNQAELNIERRQRKDYLFFEFDPTRTNGATPLPANRYYDFTDYSISYKSPSRNLFTSDSEISYGSFYNGTKFSIQSRLSYRRQPIFNMSLRLNYDYIKLPEPYPTRNIWLISPKFELTFTKKIYWTTYVQYSNQSENLGINSRLQWRFAPLSDLYLVYNDNYFTNDKITPQLRSINLKLTYWINI